MTNEQGSRGIKFDSGKVPLELLPFDALTEVAKVLRFGAYQKPKPDGGFGYGPRNWENGIEYGRLMGAATGHLWSWFTGEENDEETGLPHLAHAACDVLFLLAFSLRRRAGKSDLDALDDRPTTAVPVRRAS